MNILLVNPSFYDGEAFRNRFQDYVEWIRGGNLYVAPFEPPLGLAYLTSYVKARGHAVTLLDMQGLLMDSEALVERLKAERPQLVGITAMTPTLPAALKVARLARAVLPEAHIVLGGVHPTLDPESVLAEPAVDFVVRGEGEEAFARLLEALHIRLIEANPRKIGARRFQALEALARDLGVQWRPLVDRNRRAGGPILLARAGLSA